MAQTMASFGVCLLILFLAIQSEGAPKKPKKVKCQDKRFPDCYHVNLYCPDSCYRDCVVDCATCQPVCKTSPDPIISPPSGGHSSPPPPKTKPPVYPSPPPPPKSKSPPPPKSNPPHSPPPPKSKPPVYPPPPTAHTPPTSPPTTPTPYPPPPTNSTPVPPPPSIVPPPSSSPKRAKCKNRNYPLCYGMEHTCPSACPGGCEVDCVTCSPVCHCNRPGAVCQDPRFVGADGIAFYFHGKKDRDFCIVSDSNLHINAHFIGRRNENMKRDFTWVQSLGIRFDNHKLFIGAQKTSTWDDSVEHFALEFDREPIILPESEGSRWKSEASRLTITRTRDTNAVEIEVEDNFKIKAVVVPITEKESRIHNYGITQEDCFAHLDMSFKFYALSGSVNGVLGQTYANNYVSRAKMGVLMPVLGGDKEFSSSNLFAADCAVARFTGQSLEGNSYGNFKYANLDCASSSLGGHGVVCKR